MKNFVFIIFVTSLLFESLAFAADTVSLNHGQTSSEESSFPEITWSSTEFEVSQKTIDGKETEVAILKGEIQKGWSLLLKEHLNAFEFEDLKDQKSRFTGWVPLEEKTTHVRLVAIDVEGKIFEDEFDLILKRGKKPHWGKVLSLVYPLGVYSATTAAGGNGQTILRNSFRIGGELSWKRVFSENDPALEVKASGEVGYMFPIYGVSFPPIWNVGLTLSYRNLAHLNASHTWMLSPEVLFQYESFSSLMNQKPYPGQSLSFEYRSLQPVWIGLGSQFRLITDHRVWEFTPQVYYSPYGSTSLSVTGTHEIISGWKMALKVETSLWKSIWGGIDLNAFYLSHSTQFRGFMSFFRLSYRFN